MSSGTFHPVFLAELIVLGKLLVVLVALATSAFMRGLARGP